MCPNYNFVFILKRMEINNSLLKTIHFSIDDAINFLVNWVVVNAGYRSHECSIEDAYFLKETF